MSSARPERLALDAEALPDEVRLGYVARARLGEARATLIWRKHRVGSTVTARATARIPFKQFQFSATCERATSSGLIRCAESFGGRDREWLATSEASPQSPIAGLELPFALASTFQARARALETEIVAGGKPYRAAISQVAEGDDWIARVEIWTLTNAQATSESVKKSEFFLRFSSMPRVAGALCWVPASLAATVPMVGLLEAKLDSEVPPEKETT